MRFFETILSGAAIIAAALALEINDYPAQGVVAGQTYTITYSPKDNTPTTFILRQGPSGDLNTLDTITTTATGGSFTWTVPTTLVDEDNYALEIRQGETINYSGQFPLTGGSGAAVSSAVASVVSSAVASASSVAASAASAASSVSAELSSIVASAVSSAQASVTISPSAGLNSTVTSATLSRTASTSGRASATTSSGIPESTGAASSLASSPLAAILAIAGFAYLA